MNSKKPISHLRDSIASSETVEWQQLPRSPQQLRQIRIVDSLTLVLTNFPIESSKINHLNDFQFFGQFKNIKTVKLEKCEKTTSIIIIKFACQLSACLAYLVSLKVADCFCDNFKF